MWLSSLAMMEPRFGQCAAAAFVGAVLSQALRLAQSGQRLFRWVSPLRQWASKIYFVAVA